MKDNGMKWVIVANIMAIIVIGLLICANIIERRYEQQQNDEIEFARTYDYDLALTPQNCDNINGTANIVLITDANYMDFTRVAISSAKENKCPNSKYNFHILTLDISDSDTEALKALASDSVTISVLPQKEIDLFYIRNTHVSKASLLKYYIANVLPNLNKVLYLDTDILVLHDLNSIYNTNIDGKYLAAVKDPSWFFENTHVVELGLEERGFYFNSGVMLMNLDKIRKDNFITKLEEYTNNNYRTYMDQDAFNVLAGNEVALLPFEANTMNFFFEHIDLNTMGEFYERNWTDIDDVFKNAIVIHFASSKKPLSSMAPKTEFFHMLQRLWYKYYAPLPPLK